MKSSLYNLLFVALICSIGCSSEKPNQSELGPKDNYTTFETDINFLKEYLDIVVLQESSGKGQVAISGALQARVMTSSSNGAGGRSYGWINRGLFESGDTLDHINPFGGEERFWLGPEGGQFSIFFPKGSEFNLESWQTPRLIDLEPFDLVGSSPQKAVFKKKASLVNYSGFQFDLEIERIIEVLSVMEVFQSLELKTDAKIKVVGYRTKNTVTNRGEVAWNKETGLLSIWLPGMYNPSDATTIVIPYHEGDETDLGPVVNDTYFGKVPADRLKIGKGILFFRGDGKYRGKIGLLPSRAKDVIGSYDSENQILTIVKYTKPDGVMDYVNSAWELQENPYRGDVVNSYNDGPPEPGKQSMGPFYELETSSPALALEPGDSGTHIQQTYHFEGEPGELDQLAKQILKVSLEDIESAF